MTFLPGLRIMGLLARIVPWGCLAAVWAFAFRAHDTCFSGDDFNNLYWAQRKDGWSLLNASLNPFTDDNRPLGILAYWILLRTAGLHAEWYQHVIWCIHALNSAILYSILRKTLHSPAAAATGTLLFIYRVNFFDIAWGSGAIFEVLAALFFLAAIRLSLADVSGLGFLIPACVLYTLALNAKEMAISLPLVLLLIPGTRLAAGPKGKGSGLSESESRVIPLRGWRSVAYLSLLAAIGIGFASRKLGNVNLEATGAHHIEISLAVFEDGLVWYLNQAFGTSWPWQAWLLIALVGLGFLVKFERRGVWLLGYSLVTLLPVIFLVNHRLAFYWYIPFLGMAGLGGLLVTGIWKRIRTFIREPRLAVILGIAGFMGLSLGHLLYQLYLGRYQRAYTAQVCREHQAFVTGVQRFRGISPDAVLYFGSIPRTFSEEVLRSAVQVALRRTDVDAKLVTSWPSSARYRLRFEDSKIIVLAQP